MSEFSCNYQVRRLLPADVGEMLGVCAGNPLYYEHCPPPVSATSLLRDLRALPPGKSENDKFYLGYFSEGRLIAILDLIVDYPVERTVFIGFFMVAEDVQGRGMGSKLIDELVAYLSELGYEQLRLAYSENNLQSERFWLKNGFSPTGEKAAQSDFTVVFMERHLEKLKSGGAKEAESFSSESGLDEQVCGGQSLRCGQPPSKEDYLENPRRITSLPYHKLLKLWPEVVQMERHESEAQVGGGSSQRFFKLIHDLKYVEGPSLPEGLVFSPVAAAGNDEVYEQIAEFLQLCYLGLEITGETVRLWTESEAYEPSAWLWVKDRDKCVGLGIGEIDRSINEGVLEWIQVLPGYRRNGLGSAIVLELLRRLQVAGADFVMVSGNADSEFSVSEMYRKVGFVGSDIFVIRGKK
ncbi:MAG: GNAT family N-acetyltransferase [Eubacteriales bacterium]|nr:GNAT family N-acetyltransferase [Eubacteriales bacterium]